MSQGSEVHVVNGQVFLGFTEDELRSINEMIDYWLVNNHAVDYISRFERRRIYGVFHKALKTMEAQDGVKAQSAT